jgi:ferredoxin
LTLECKAKYIEALETGSFHKLIIGAALKDYEMIENFSYLFTSAEADAIDISAFPHSVVSAIKGINKALKEDRKLNKPLLMISVNIGDDPHFRRIELNSGNCTECLACIPTCPSNAFSVSSGGLPRRADGAPRNDIFAYNPDLCFGCSNCLPACPFDALSFDNWSPFSTSSLKDLSTLGADAIEIHLNQDLEAFTNFYKDLDADLFKLESFCIGSTISSTDELTASADLVIQSFYSKYKGNKSFILQVDGEPLSGARFSKDAAKDQISIEKAKIIIKHIEEEHPEYKDNIFIQLAGGITENTLKKARSQNVAINGIAIGSYARKYLDNLRREKNLDVPELKVYTKNLLTQSKNT